MKRKLIIIVSIITILTVFSATATSYGANKLDAPNITVKTVNQNYVKVSWKKVTGASKYYIYRATSKNGDYKKIKTTTARYYNDKSTKNKQYYYYKVKAVNSSTSSKYSDIKRGRVYFKGKLVLDANNVIMGLGETRIFYLDAYNCDDIINAYYNPDYFQVEFGKTIDGKTEVVVDVIDNRSFDVNETIEFKFKNHERHYSKRLNITVEANEEIKKYDWGNNDIYDFGDFLGIVPVSSKNEIKNAGYFYSYQSIIENGYAVENVIKGYSYLISIDGYESYKTASNKYGGMDTYYKNGTGTNIIIADMPTMENGSVMIFLSN